MLPPWCNPGLRTFQPWVVPARDSVCRRFASPPPALGHRHARAACPAASTATRVRHPCVRTCQRCVDTAGSDATRRRWRLTKRAPSMTRTTGRRAAKPLLPLSCVSVLARAHGRMRNTRCPPILSLQAWRWVAKCLAKIDEDPRRRARQTSRRDTAIVHALKSAVKAQPSFADAHADLAYELNEYYPSVEGPACPCPCVGILSGSRPECQLSLRALTWVGQDGEYVHVCVCPAPFSREPMPTTQALVLECCSHCCIACGAQADGRRCGTSVQHCVCSRMTRRTVTTSHKCSTSLRSVPSKRTRTLRR